MSAPPSPPRPRPANDRTSRRARAIRAASAAFVLAALTGAGAAAAQPITPTVTLATAPNPSASGATFTLTATVTGTQPTGAVTFRRVSGGAALCDAVPLAGSGDVRTASCGASLTQAGANALVADYGGDAAHHPRASADHQHFVHPAPVNVALAANGGVATASSTIAVAGANFGVAAVNDGVRTGANWGQGGGWNDATLQAFPDWVQVAFAGQRLVDRVVLVTLPDDYATPSEPGDAKSFSLYGITAFQVQTWNGTAWVTQATVTGNNLVKRTVAFAPVRTDRVRIVVTGALASYARVVELEAWTPSTLVATTTTVASSANPAVPHAPVTFTATVNGGAPAGQVRFRLTAGELGDADLCFGAVVAGKASCTATPSPYAVPVTVLAEYLGDTAHLPSTGTMSQSFVNDAASVNVAAYANGASATASSTYTAAGVDFGPIAAIDGIAASYAWGQGWGGGWNDGTAGGWPDWLQVNFSGPQTIDKVVVFTLRDDFGAAGTPSDVETFTQWGVTGFQVQTWNGTTWTTRATVTGNTLVKRTVTFAPVTTDRIRVVVTSALAQYSRIAEVQAWTTGGPVPSSVALSSSHNPATPGATVRFTANVGGASNGGSVTFQSHLILCTTVPLVNGVATCDATFTSGSYEVTATFSGSANVLGSTSPILVQQVLANPPPSNVALAANGGVASASSTIVVAGANFGVAAVNDGLRTGANWGQGGGWNNGTGGVFPDWVQVRFAGPRTIDRVVLVGLQDAFAAPVEPGDAMTFSQWGITAFQVQTWNGSTWTTRATVTGNALVKRTVTFAPVSTDRVRIVVTGALASYARVVELEAWTAQASSLGAASKLAGAPPAAAADADDAKALADAAPIPSLGALALGLLALLLAGLGATGARRRRSS